MKRTIALGMLIWVVCVIYTHAQDSDNRYIREDRVWEYYKMSPYYWMNHIVSEIYPDDNDLNGNEDFYGLYTYRFKGTEEHGGLVYHKCILEKALIWTENDREDPPSICIVDTVVLNRCVGLVREEDGKVYLRSDSTKATEYLYPYDGFTEKTLQKDEDLLLYDFSLKEGDIFMPYLTNRFLSRGIITECTVGSVNEEDGRKIFAIEQVNKDESTYRLSLGKYASGIGNIGEGYMLEYGWMQEIPIDSKHKIITKEQWVNLFINDIGCWSWFNNYYDLEGNVLYPGFNARPPAESGIGQVTDTEIDNGASAVYDMMGRRVTRTLPGSVYITNGRKFIAR